MGAKKKNSTSLYSSRSLKAINKYAPLYGIIGSSKITPAQRKGIIDSLNAAQAGGFVYILRDVVKNADNLPSEFSTILRKKKKHIRQLLGKEGKKPDVRKKVLRQKGGFIPQLLGALVAGTLPLIVKGFKRLVKR